jgi:DNA repair protein RadC
MLKGRQIQRAAFCINRGFSAQSKVKARLATPDLYGFRMSEASALLEHFGSFSPLARASVQELLPFLSPSKAAQLVSSLRLAAVALREERSHLVIDTSFRGELCAETWFLLHESLRVVLLDTKQRLIKVVSVSEGTLNEALSEHAKSLNR